MEKGIKLFIFKELITLYSKAAANIWLFQKKVESFIEKMTVLFLHWSMHQLGPFFRLRDINPVSYSPWVINTAGSSKITLVNAKSRSK